jgi:transcriptional regulator with XRE-family HTH domain
MREGRGWSQGKLAEEVGMAQPRISLLEGGYEKYSLTTLKRIASTFDVAVVVRFVPFSELVDWVANLSEGRLAPVEFANDNLLEEDDEADGDMAAAYAPADAKRQPRADLPPALVIADLTETAYQLNAPAGRLIYFFDVSTTHSQELGSAIVAGGAILNGLAVLNERAIERPGIAPVINNVPASTAMSLGQISPLPAISLAEAYSV